MKIIGIDPGISGGIAILNEDGSYESLHDIPLITIKEEKRVKTTKADREINPKAKTKKATTTRKELDIKAIHDLIPDNSKIIIEDVSAMPGQGVTSMFTFGKNYGILLSIIALKGAEVHTVRPAKWQKHFGLTMSKNDKEGKTKGEITSIHKQNIADKVLSIYPEVQIRNERGTLKDGRSDSLMIARYGFEKL